DKDLAVANDSSYNVSILLNNGSGAFSTAVNYGAGVVPNSVFAADLDGDGDKDLAVANRVSHYVSILENLSGAGGECDYVVGNVNGSSNYNGLDITYGVAFFKGGPGPLCPVCPPCPDWNYCGDVNGSCNYNGLDITYGVAYFKGGPGPIHCADCPPTGNIAVSGRISRMR
ncbi:MAG: VCBS repeat-containing protein, partial [Candidatus Zixiibacteriota bacterium]